MWTLFLRKTSISRSRVFNRCICTRYLIGYLYLGSRQQLCACAYVFFSVAHLSPAFHPARKKGPTYDKDSLASPKTPLFQHQDSTLVTVVSLCALVNGGQHLCFSWTSAGWWLFFFFCQRRFRKGVPYPFGVVEVKNSHSLGIAPITLDVNVRTVVLLISTHKDHYISVH